MNIVANILIISALSAGGILLQIFLSKRESKWFGLILPFITFSYSLLMVFSVAVTDDMTWWDTCGVIAASLFIYNIPTIIFLAIYFGCRQKKRQKKALEKMNIQDLE